MCLQEMRGRLVKGRELSGWESERARFFEERGVEWKELERRRDEGEVSWERVEEDDRRRQKEKRWGRIERSKYNRNYRLIKREGMPEYLERWWVESRWRRVMRFGMGNKMGERRYWEEEEKSMCRMCGDKLESWEHVWEECRE